jgi:hypothetical protein
VGSAPVLFLSFASEDAAWKTNFVNPVWFGNILGTTHIVDYQNGGALPFGPIDDWATDKIRRAAVFVAFVSEFYIQKKFPLFEWHSALSDVSRKELIFVPVLLDSAAKQWWTDLKQRGELRVLGGDYAYADFTDGSGKPLQINTAIGPVDSVVRKISELARLIKENLQPHNSAGGEPDPGRSIVVLGHPTAVSDPAVAKQAVALRNLLSERGRQPLCWNDQWRTSSASRPRPANFFSKGAIFIQPTAPGDAGDFAQDPQKVRKWLSKALNDLTDGTSLKNFKIVLWLPAGLSDEGFAEAIAESDLDADLLLRHDDLESLVEWLTPQLEGRQHLPEIPILTLEEVDDNPKLREALHSGFRAVVDDVINPPPEAWTFKGPMLIDQISTLDVDRAIVAIHDLNTGIAKEPREARLQLEQKLGAMARDVERAIKSAGRSDLKLFWTALLVQKAKQLPWVKYPSPSRFEQWCLLPFESSQNDQAEVVVRAKQIETDVFRSYLREWVHRPTA